MAELRLIPSNVVSLDAYRQARQEMSVSACLYPAVGRWMKFVPSDPEPPKRAA